MHYQIKTRTMLLAKKKEKKFNPQAIQDRIFRKMSAEKKLDVLQGFIEFANILQKAGKNGSQGHSKKTVPST